MEKRKYLLDTNICIFLLRKKHNVDEYIRKIGIDNCYISEITVAELLYGAECSSNIVLNLGLIKDFCNNIKIFKISDCLSVFAQEKAKLRKEGNIIDDFDLLIGSTAIFNNCILVTNNIKHLGRLQVPIENWIKS